MTTVIVDKLHRKEVVSITSFYQFRKIVPHQITNTTALSKNSKNPKPSATGFSVIIFVVPPELSLHNGVVN